VISATLLGCSSGSPPATYSKFGLPRLGTVAGRIEQIRSLRYKRLPTVQVVTPEQFQSLLEKGDLSARDVSQPSRTTRFDTSAAQRAAEAKEALQLLGAVPGGAAPFGAHVRAGSDVAGAYLPRREAIYLVAHRGQRERGLEVVLAHEMLHALEFQRFGRSRLLHSLRTDSQRKGFQALVEGSAVWVEYLYAKRYLGLRQTFAAYVTRKERPTGRGRQVAPYLVAEVLFPYVQGARFVQTLWRKANDSWQLVNQAETRPPDSSQAVLHPLRWLQHLPSSALRFDAGPFLASNRWKLIGAVPVGEFATDALLTPGMLPALRSKTVMGWNGAYQQLWRDADAAKGCTAPCPAHSVLVETWRWTNEIHARQADSVIGSYVRRVLGGTGGPPAWSTKRDTNVHVVTRRRTTTLVLAADRQLAQRVAEGVARQVGR
jgi:hypothetical protein